MLNAEINKIKCPVCGNSLGKSAAGKSLVCNKGHCFDISSDGYVNFASTSVSGDSKEAVAARRTFLDSGAYSPLKDEIFSLTQKYASKSTLIADLGCGDGYYSASLPEVEGVEVFGVDLSKFAVRAASKRAKSLGLSDKTLYSVASVFEVPLSDDSTDIVLNLFAPCAEKEFKRILKPGGILILVGAGRNHLKDLKALIYDEIRLNDERKDLPSTMQLINKYSIETHFRPTVPERDSLFTMTPYYYKTSIKDKERLSSAPECEIGAEFDIYIYKNI